MTDFLGRPDDAVIISAGVEDPYLPEGDSGALHVFKPGERLEGLPADWAPMLADLGVTLLQLDSPHMTTPEPAEGRWDWARIDRLAAGCRDGGFGVCFFSHWHWPPPWVQQTREVEGLHCLEHGERLPCFSIWEPGIVPWFERCVAESAGHFADRPPRAIMAGVYGDYGECMFPTSDTATIADRARFDGGAAIDHCHGGFWCGDRYAREDFRARMLAKYGTTDALNRAWGRPADAAAEIAFPAPETGSRRAWLDFVGWYHDSMTRFAQRVAEIHRRHFPDALVCVPIGGGVERNEFGQDNSAICRAMARCGAAVRSTAGGCLSFNRAFGRVEKFTRGYAVVKRVASACRFYGAPMSIEPPYPPNRDEKLLVAGAFEALSCGVSGWNDWGWTYRRQGKILAELLPHLCRRQARVDTAVLFPTTAHRLKPTAQVYWDNLPPRWWAGCAALRRVCDYDVVDEPMVADGALDGFKMLIVFEAHVIEQRTVASVRRWVAGGGRLVVQTAPDMQTVEGERVDWASLAGQGKVHTMEEQPDDVGPLIDSIDRLRRDAEQPCVALRGDGDPAAVFATRFDDGWSVLNLNDEAVEASMAGRTVAVPANRFRCIDEMP